MSRALIAMSGGVDSAVAALLMRDAGYDCVGCTMRLFGGDDAETQSACCSLDDVEDAKAIARRLGIPHYTFNFTDEFRTRIIDRFIDDYFAGRTPNPCIECNRCMKFEKLLLRARELSCDCLATGHYARIEVENGRYLLKKALDPAKDQSYVLYMLTPEQLKRLRFPLGALTKAEARRIAAENGFINAEKPDSQDICFVPDGDYAAVIERFSGRRTEPGDFIDREGNVLGRHKGVIHYTIGQRRGLGVPGPRSYYVTAIDPAANTVTLSFGEGLFTDTVTLHKINLIAADRIDGALRAKAKIRYRQPEQPVTVTQPDGDTLLLRFDAPQRAVTPGQAAVLYLGDTVLGGGTIE